MVVEPQGNNCRGSVCAYLDYQWWREGGLGKRWLLFEHNFFFFFNWVMTISPQPANTLPWYRGFIECREKPIAGSGIPGIARCGCKWIPGGYVCEYIWYLLSTFNEFHQRPLLIIQRNSLHSPLQLLSWRARQSRLPCWLWNHIHMTPTALFHNKPNLETFSSSPSNVNTSYNSLLWFSASRQPSKRQNRHKPRWSDIIPDKGPLYPRQSQTRHS